ncbi:MAG TPA: hypothetical protein VFU21_28295 [Kofleriaceae bacterium]|nr:hypothetical protein [Kofleriaceae bacterium]
MPEGDVGSRRDAFPERAPDVVGVTVTAPGGQTANAFVRVVGDRVVVPAGPSQAARELADMRVLEKGPWDGGLIYLVLATGGMMPAWPDVLGATETPLAGGGVRITMEVEAAIVDHALGGAAGPSPARRQREPRGAGGLAPPPEMTTATVDIGPDYALRWVFTQGGRPMEGPSGAPADGPPRLSGDQLMTALEGARQRARAPRAMPSLEPRLLDNIPDIAEVPLFGLGPVYVDLRGAAGRSPRQRLDAINPAWTSNDARDLVVLLSAVDALPPGLVPDDLLATAQVARGVLTAEVPAPLVTWAAGRARQLSPRVRGVASPADMEKRVRISMRLDSLEWNLGGGAP